MGPNSQYLGRSEPHTIPVPAAYSHSMVPGGLEVTS